MHWQLQVYPLRKQPRRRVSRLQKARDTFAKAKSRRENREAEETQARAAQEKNRKKREELRNRLMNKKK